MTGYQDATLHNFLLDELSSAEREEIEQRIFADDELFHRVEELEASMIDEYVSGAMPVELRARFARSLQSSPARREQVHVTTLLAEKLHASRREHDARVLPFARRYAKVFRGAMAAALLGVIIGTPMLLRKADEPSPVAPSAVDARSKVQKPVVTPEVPETVDVATATESAATSEVPLIAVKRPPVPTVTPETTPITTAPALRSMTFVLSTISLRSGAGLPVLEKADGVETIAMQLALETDEYPTYNVDIRDASGTSVWHGSRIPVMSIDDGPALTFQIPASALSKGRHELVLAGVDEGHTEEVAYVDFDVR